MNSLDHAAARRLIVEGEESAAIRSHLEGCGACARFASNLQARLRLAAELTPAPMPPGLPDKVLDRVRVTRPLSRPIAQRPTVLPAPPRHSPRREIAVSVAVVLLMIGALLIPLLTRESAQAVLRAASHRTAEERTARLALNGTIGGRVANAMSHDDAGRVGSAASSDSLRLSMEAKGEVAFNDRLRLTGLVQVDDAPKGFDVREDSFDLLLLGNRSLALGPSGFEDRTRRPPAGQILRGPDSLLNALDTGSRGGVVRLEDKEVNGERLQGFRFQLPATLLHVPFTSSSASPWTAEAWISGIDRTLRILKVSGRGTAASPTGINWEASVSTQLFGFGAPLFEKPEPGSVVADGVLVLPLPPDRRLERFAGALVEANTVEVHSVVSDEGFWIGQTASDRIFVHLLAAGESRVTVTPQSRVSFLGVMRQNPPRLSSLGVTSAEGEKLLNREGHHIQVPAETLRLQSR